MHRRESFRRTLASFAGLCFAEGWPKCSAACSELPCTRERFAPFLLAYGHEALARAALLTGDVAVLNDHLAKAWQLATAVADPEDRRLLEADLLSLSNS